MKKLIQLIELVGQRAYEMGQEDAKTGKVETKFKLDKAGKLFLLNTFENNVTVGTRRR